MEYDDEKHPTAMGELVATAAATGEGAGLAMVEVAESSTMAVAMMKFDENMMKGDGRGLRSTKVVTRSKIYRSFSRCK